MPLGRGAPWFSLAENSPQSVFAGRRAAEGCDAGITREPTSRSGRPQRLAPARAAVREDGGPRGALAVASDVAPEAKARGAAAGTARTARLLRSPARSSPRVRVPLSPLYEHHTFPTGAQQYSGPVRT